MPKVEVVHSYEADRELKKQLDEAIEKVHELATACRGRGLDVFITATSNKISAKVERRIE